MGACVDAAVVDGVPVLVVKAGPDPPLSEAEMRGGALNPTLVSVRGDGWLVDSDRAGESGGRNSKQHHGGYRNSLPSSRSSGGSGRSR